MYTKDHIDVVKEYEKISETYGLEKNEDQENIPSICKVLDKFVFKVGAAISWLSPVLILLIVTQVLLRYMFTINYAWLGELQWHLYGTMVVFGLSYSMVNHSHVRVDILRIHFSGKLQRKIEIFCILFFMIPFIYIVINYGYNYANEAFRVNEVSNAPEGLPYRWIIKSMIPISFSMLLISSISRLIRHISFLIKGENNGN